jgi:hypothetical protein
MAKYGAKPSGIYLIFIKQRLYNSIMKETFSALIRRAILESGQTRYAIAVKCGVDQAVLSRFMSGKSNLNLATVDKLVAGLGIEAKIRRTMKGNS